MKRKSTPGSWKMRIKETFSRPLVRFASLFKEPRKLWVVFSLRLSLATLIPILVLYILSKWGYIEASQELDFREPTVEPLAIEVAIPDAVILSDVFEPDDTETSSADRRDVRTWLPVSEPGLPIAFDPETGTWQVDAENARFVFSSNIFRFRVDVPAWIAIGSLPLVSLMIGVLLSIWMSRGVTRPFSRLAKAAHAIGRRDLGYRVQTEGSQELVDLAQSFNRTDEFRGRDRGGSGLGLAIAKAILEAQGGSIDAQSPGKGLGSTFTIHLPVG